MNRAYLDQLLQVDAAIIGSDNTHFILAVRLDKRALAKNHQLLLGLSEMAAGASGEHAR